MGGDRKFFGPKMGGKSKNFYSGGDGQMGGMSEIGGGFKFDRDF